VFAPLNDYVATVIGMVRDDVAFDRVLYDDILYVGSGPGVPAYSPANNDHYAALEARGVSLKDTAAQCEMSRTTVIAAVKAYEAGGWKAVNVDRVPTAHDHRKRTGHAIISPPRLSKPQECLISLAATKLYRR